MSLEPLRILYLSPAAELGGAERCLLDCIASLQASAPAATVRLLSLAHGPLIEKARALGAEAEVIELPSALMQLGERTRESASAVAFGPLLSSAPATVRFLASLRQAIARGQPDIVHTNGMKAHLLAGLLAPFGARLVIHLHDFIGVRRASSRLIPLLSRIRRRATFIANSAAVARDFAHLAPRARIRTIYNVVDTDYFRPGPADPAWLAARAGLDPPPEGALSFGLVATYARWKGHALFIEAAGKLQAAHPGSPFRFYVVGGPIYQTLGSQVCVSELHSWAKAARIESSFGLSPFQNDIAPVYRSLDVVVHASTEPEPFGRTIVEAMACGRPVIVARAGGAAELFRHGENAIGYQPADVNALAGAMVVLLDADRRARLGRAARGDAVAHFSRARLAPELIRVYEETWQA